MDRAEDVKLNRVLQQQRLLQQRRWSGEQSGRTQPAVVVPTSSSAGRSVTPPQSTTVETVTPRSVVSSSVENSPQSGNSNTALPSRYSQCCVEVKRLNYIALHEKPTSEPWDTTCRMGSHSICYLPPKHS